MPNYLTSAAAATRLGVSRQTLYAYVSRGLLHAETGATPRESRYLAEEVERLAAQRTRGRKPKEVAKATLNWGLPVLESAITLIEDGQLFYRGENAVALAQSSSVEAVAAHLWQCDQAMAFGAAAPGLSEDLAALFGRHRGQRAEAALLPLFTAASDDDATALWQRSPERQAQGCGALVRTLAACLLQTAPDDAPIHAQCARAWGVDAAGADLIRMALVLCADHELNASSFTARCIASTGASLRAGIVGGLAALTGGRHGATTARVEAMWEELERGGGGADAGQRLARGLRERLARGEDMPGFGHHLYPAGDPRASALLARILPRRPEWETLIEQAFELSGQRPSVDFSLVAVRRHLGLPPGAAFGLFALGRSIGWLAHGLEQRGSPDVIRPRAAYTGIHPDAA